MHRNYLFRRISYTSNHEMFSWSINWLYRKFVTVVVRWYRRIAHSVGEIPLSDILAVNVQASRIGREEKNYFQNYRVSSRAAKQLFDKGFIRDGCLMAHLAAEHLIKHLLVKTSLAYQQNYRKDLITKTQKANKIHDVKLIIIEVSLRCSQFKSLTEVDDLDSTLTEFNQRIGDWASARYKNPSIDTVILSQKYQELRQNTADLIRALRTYGAIR